jgi:hypothetical protein
MRASPLSLAIPCLGLALAALLGGCVMPPLEPRSVLDERSGASLTVVDQPLILARERRDVAVQARDYLTLVAAEINESGRRRLVWALHQWSTIDARAADEKPLPSATLMLIADGRDMRLVPIADSAATAYSRNPALMAPEDANAVTTLYGVDEATLEFVATSRQLSASFPDARLSLPFLLWADGRPALSRFLQELQPLK